MKLLILLLGLSTFTVGSATTIEAQETEDVQEALSFIYQLQFQIHSPQSLSSKVPSARVRDNQISSFARVHIREMDLVKKSVVLELIDKKGHAIIKHEDLLTVEYDSKAEENPRVKFRISQTTEAPTLNYNYWGISKIQKSWNLTVDLLMEVAYLESEYIVETPSVFYPWRTHNQTIKTKYSTLLQGPETSRTCQLLLLRDFRK